MTIVEFLRLVQSVPYWDRTPAILDSDLEGLFRQLGEEPYIVIKRPFVSGDCRQCVRHYVGSDNVDMCSGNHVDVGKRICSDVSVCNIFCKCYLSA